MFWILSALVSGAWGFGSLSATIPASCLSNPLGRELAEDAHAACAAINQPLCAIHILEEALARARSRNAHSGRSILRFSADPDVLAALGRRAAVLRPGDATPYWDCLVRPILECSAWSSGRIISEFEAMPLRQRLRRGIETADHWRLASIARRDQLMGLFNNAQPLPNHQNSDQPPSRDTCLPVVARAFEADFAETVSLSDTQENPNQWNRAPLRTLFAAADTWVRSQLEPQLELRRSREQIATGLRAIPVIAVASSLLVGEAPSLVAWARSGLMVGLPNGQASDEVEYLRTRGRQVIAGFAARRVWLRDSSGERTWGDQTSFCDRATLSTLDILRRVGMFADPQEARDQQDRILNHRQISSPTRMTRFGLRVNTGTGEAAWWTPRPCGLGLRLEGHS